MVASVGRAAATSEQVMSERRGKLGGGGRNGRLQFDLPAAGGTSRRQLSLVSGSSVPK